MAGTSRIDRYIGMMNTSGWGINSLRCESHPGTCGSHEPQFTKAALYTNQCWNMLTSVSCQIIVGNARHKRPSRVIRPSRLQGRTRSRYNMTAETTSPPTCHASTDHFMAVGRGVGPAGVRVGPSTIQAPYTYTCRATRPPPRAAHHFTGVTRRR